MIRHLLRITFSAGAALVLMAQMAPAQVDVRSADMVALYKFDETSGIVAEDSATLEGPQNATQNQGTVAWTTGLIGGALDLDGASSLQAMDAVGMGSTALTFSVWVNMDDTPGYDGIYSARDQNWGINVEGGSTENLHYDLRFDNDPGGGSVGRDTANGSAVVGQWQHVAMTWSTESDVNSPDFARYYYLNGVRIGDAPNSSIASVYTGHLSTWNIGDDPCCGGRELDAQLDELAVWNVALTEAEINTIYTNGLSGVGLLAPVDTSLPGDANGDGLVNNLDFEIIRANFGRDGFAEGVTLEAIDGDIVNDNVINFLDYGEWKQVSPKDPDAGALAGLAGAPEPSAIALMGLLGVAAGYLRRRS